MKSLNPRALRAILIGAAISMFSQAALAAKELKVLAWEGYVPEEVRPEIEAYLSKKFGEKITVKIDYIVDEKSIFNAAREGTYDILDPCLDHLSDPTYQFPKKGLVLPIRAKNIPNAKYVDPFFKSLPAMTYKGETYAVPYIGGVARILL